MEPEQKHRKTLPFKWHAILCFCCVIPVSVHAATGNIEYVDEDFPKLSIGLILFWLFALLLWIPAMLHIAPNYRLKDILLVLAYPALSFVIFFLSLA